MSDYEYAKKARQYIEFLNSKNGQIQQHVLGSVIFSMLPKNNNTTIIDAACGSGWLAHKLSKTYKDIKGFDSSTELISFAQKKYPNISFSVEDVTKHLPYKESFEVVILNMAATDLGDLTSAFKNIASAIKKGGQLIMTIPNPHYTFPVGVWKRSLMDVLLFKKPKLVLNKSLYKTQRNIQREFGNGTTLTSNFYTLEDYISAAQNTGLILTIQKELSSKEDSKEFNLTYQLYRYPLFLLLTFRK